MMAWERVRMVRFLNNVIEWVRLVLMIEDSRCYDWDIPLWSNTLFPSMSIKP